MKKTMLTLSLLSLFGLTVTAMIWLFTKNPVSFSLSITFGTTLYHFVMRLCVGTLINGIFHNRMDFTKKWFAQKRFEPALYRWLRVREWKKHLPSYNPEVFDIKRQTLTEIVQGTCQAEIVHEVIMILSFVPLLFSLWFDAFGVFLITSVAACLFDSLFVILQRYNRPRLIRLMERQNARFQ